MAALEERLSYLEGQVVLLPQMIGQVGERLDRAEASLSERVGQAEATLGHRIDHVEATLRAQIDRLEDRMYSLLGIQITTFVTTLAAILAVFHIRS